MLTFLEEILHGILDIPYLIINLLIMSIDGLILLISYFILAVISLLPGLPSRPEVPEEVLRGVAWFFPLGLLFPAIAGLIASYILYLAIKVTLNWAKVNL